MERLYARPFYSDVKGVDSAIEGAIISKRNGTLSTLYFFLGSIFNLLV